MHPSRRHLPLLGTVLVVAAALLLFAWFLVRVPSEGPLKMRLLKVASGPEDLDRPALAHELVELEVENPTKTKVLVHLIQLHSEKVSSKILASPDRSRGYLELDPGKTKRITLIAYERRKSGIPWEDWEPKVFYGWSEDEKSLRQRLRIRYNQRQHKLPKWLKRFFPHADTIHAANIRDIAFPSPSAPAQGASTHLER